MDGMEGTLFGDSPAIEQSIHANLPYLVYGGFDLGNFLVQAGETAANNALSRNH